jgi:alpha-glucosidase (family GH31 glycosyl hydrolase)
MPVRLSCRPNGCSPLALAELAYKNGCSAVCVSSPFNSEFMEDVLLMKAYGIPCGVYWIDRPWGPGSPWGYDDFEIDEKRLPHFAEMVKWLNGQDTQMLLWIAPVLPGANGKEATAKGYTLAGQKRPC